MSPGLSENGFIVTVRPVIPEEKGPQEKGHQRALQGRGRQTPSALASPYSCGLCLLRPANAPRSLPPALFTELEAPLQPPLAEGSEPD